MLVLSPPGPLRSSSWPRKAVIPNNPSHARKYPLDSHLYAQRHLIECCFAKLKQFGRVATRSEKTARSYLAVITIAATIASDQAVAASVCEALVGDRARLEVRQ
jgi:transposase